MLARIDDEKREQDAKKALEEAFRTLLEIKRNRPLTKEEAEELSRRAT